MLDSYELSNSRPLLPRIICPACTPTTVEPWSNSALSTIRLVPNATRRVLSGKSWLLIQAVVRTASESDHGSQVETTLHAQPGPSKGNPWTFPTGTSTCRSPPKSLATLLSPDSGNHTTECNHRTSPITPLQIISPIFLNLDGINELLHWVASVVCYMKDFHPNLDCSDPRARKRVLSASKVSNVAHSTQRG